MLRFLICAFMLSFSSFPLRADDTLKVLQRAPDGELESLEAGREVVITFNRPMVDLSSGEDAGSFCPCQIKPTLPGRCRWRGTNTLAYEFDKIPGPGHVIEVTVAKGTTSKIDGKKLEDDVHFSFLTLRPRFSAAIPQNNTAWLGLHPSFFVQFRVPMDLSLALMYVKIFNNGQEPVPFRVFGHTLKEINKEKARGHYDDLSFNHWMGSDQILEFKPVEALLPASNYQLVIEPGWPAAGGEAGPAGLNQGTTLNFSTYGPFSALGVTSDSICHARPGLLFSNPVLVDNLTRYVKVSPSVEVSSLGEEDSGYSSYQNGNRYRMDLSNWKFLPETKYHFEILPGLKDVFGNALTETAEFDWNAPELCSSFSFNGGFGVLESYLPPRHPVDAVNLQGVSLLAKTLDPNEAVKAYQLASDAWPKEHTLDGAPEAFWPIATTRNARAHTYIDLKKLLGPGMGSFSFLATKSPESNLRNQYWINALDNYTDLGLTLKGSPDSSLIWVTSLKDGRPRPNVPVEIRDPENNVLWKGASDSQGLAHAPGWIGLGLKDWNHWNAPELFVMAQSPQGWALLSSQYHEGIEPWRFNMPMGSFFDPGSSSHRYDIFSDRGVYRPGEKVYFKGLVRDLSAGDWIVPAGLNTLKLEVFDSRSELTVSATAQVSGNGSFEYSFEIPKDAVTGTWWLLPSEPGTGTPKHPERQYFRQGLRYNFRVEAVKPASYEVRLSNLKPWVHLGDKIDAQVVGSYLAGSGMPGAQGSWNLTLQPASFSSSLWKDWDFSTPRLESFEDWGGDEDEGEGEDEEEPDDSNGSQTILGGTGNFELDAKSTAQLSIPTKGLKKCSPCSATLEVNLSSPDRQKLFVRANTMLHVGCAYPGFKYGKGATQVGEDFPLSWVVVDPDGRTLTGRKVSLRLIREERQNVRTVGAFDRLEWRSEEKLEEVGRFNFISSDKPSDWSFKPQAPGRYRLALRAIDADGNSQESGGFFYVYGKGEASWMQDESNMIELVPDKTEYKVGDVAKVIVKSPFEKSTALITLEREGVQQALVETLGQADALEIPITESLLPNIYLGVALSQGRAQTQSYGKSGEDLAKPQSRFGYTMLAVRPEGRKLLVQASVAKPEYRPGAQVDAAVKVTDIQGAGVASEVTLYAADEGMLKLTDYQTPDPFSFFYGPRALLISTADNRLAVIGTRNYGEKGQERGGGGADLDKSRAALGLDLRRKFESLAFWKSDLHTDAHGNVSVKFNLPDNLTRFRLIAVAAEGKRFGSGETVIKVNQPLALRPSLPRFARLGDKFEAGVTIQNSSPFSGPVAVVISASSEINVEGSSSQTFELKPGEAKELRWKLSAVSLGQAVLRFRAAGQLGGAEMDALQWTLPVSLPEKAETAATSGVVSQMPVTEGVAQASNASANSSKLEFEFSSTAMLGLSGGLEYLTNYPNLCLEQRMSRILPVVVAKDMLDAFKIGSSKEATAEAQAELDMLPQFQDGSGGYRYWTENWMLPDPWLTAYVLEVTAMAKESGFNVPQNSIDHAVEWLRTNYDNNAHWSYPYSEAERQILRAWALYALSRHGVKLPGLYSDLYSKRALLPIYGKANLLRVSKSWGTPEETATLSQELLNQAQVDARGMHFEDIHDLALPWVHASTVSTTGFCLDALLSANGGFSGDDKVARWLALQRKSDGAWDDTQSNAWALMGLARYFRIYEKEEPNFKATLFRAGNELWKGDFSGHSLLAVKTTLNDSELFNSSPRNQFEIHKSGQGRLYYDMALSWIPMRVDKPAYEGFEITRDISSLSGSKVSGAFVAGERYLVTLSVRSRVERTFVALTDYLPGGFEIVDSSLATESRVAPPTGGTSSSVDDPWGGWWGRFQRHENYDDRVQVYADFLSAGEHAWKYVVQATTPGTFMQPSAWVEMMYQPEVYGRSTGAEIAIRLPDESGQ